jgi:hypothetical protein
LGATGWTTWAAFDLTSLAPPASDCPASTTQLHFSNRPHQGLDPADSSGRNEIEAGSFVFEFGHSFAESDVRTLLRIRMALLP